MQLRMFQQADARWSGDGGRWRAFVICARYGFQPFGVALVDDENVEALVGGMAGSAGLLAA